MKKIIGLAMFVFVLFTQTLSAQRILATGNKGGFAIGGFNAAAVGSDIGNYNTSRSNREFGIIVQGGPITIEAPLNFQYLGLGYPINISSYSYLKPKIDFDWNVKTANADEKVFKVIPGLALGANIFKIGRFQSYLELNAFYSKFINENLKERTKGSNFEYSLNIGVTFCITKPKPESISEVELQGIPEVEDETDSELRARAKRMLTISPGTGEPVPGADIFIEQDDDAPIAYTETDSNGNFSFTIMLHPGRYTVHYGINDEGTKAPGNKGGFAVGGFNAAIVAPGPGDEQDEDSVSFEILSIMKESNLTKPDSKKSLSPITISGEDETTLVRITVPQNTAVKKWYFEAKLIRLPVKKVIKFKAGQAFKRSVK